MFIPVSIMLYPSGPYLIPQLKNGIPISQTITSYSHSIVANGGCESASIKLEVPIETASEYLQYILYDVRVSDEYSQLIWLGYINRISLEYGGNTTTIGVNNYASRFVLFVNGVVAGTLYDDDAARQFGDKIEFIRVDANTLNATAVTQNMTRALLQKGSPNIENKTTSETKSRQNCTITIDCAGYYSMAEWKTVGASAFAGTGFDTLTAISSHVQNQVFTNIAVGGGPYIRPRNAKTGPVVPVNPAPATREAYWLPFTQIVDVTTNRWDAYTPWSQVIGDLIDMGNVDGQVISFGIFQEGWFDINISRINYSFVDYYKSIASSKIFDVNGSEIPPTQVLPDRNISITELLPRYTPYAQQIIGLQYINRVSLQIARNGYSLTLEPATLNDASYELARLVKKAKWRRNNR